MEVIQLFLELFLYLSYFWHYCEGFLFINFTFFLFLIYVNVIDFVYWSCVQKNSLIKLTYSLKLFTYNLKFVCIYNHIMWDSSYFSILLITYILCLFICFLPHLLGILAQCWIEEAITGITVSDLRGSIFHIATLWFLI